MQPTNVDIRQALLDRLEADRRLGISAVPIAPSRANAKRPAFTSVPSPGGSTRASTDGAKSSRSGDVSGAAPLTVLEAPAPLSEAELNERTLALTVIDDGEVKGCRRCGLHSTRNHTVFGVGSPQSRILFVGEAPGHDEDLSGEPFVGRAGQLLTDMIEKGMGLKRSDVYICNVLKCRPPNNRTPASDEIIACKGYLWRQIEIIRPQVIIALGAPAAQTLLGTTEAIGRLRSRWHDFYPSGSPMIGEAIPVMPTYHPAYLLRSPDEKKKSWADLKMVMARLGIPLPSRG